MPYVVVRFNGEETHRLAFEEPITIGRDLSCDIWIGDPALSRVHCRIEQDDKGRWLVVDQNSRNGVYYKDQRFSRFAARDGDTFKLGGVKLKFHAGSMPVSRPKTPLHSHHASLMTPVVGPVSDHVAPTQAATKVLSTRRPPPRPQPKGVDEVAEPLTKPFSLAFQRPAPRPILQAPPATDQAIDPTPAQSQNWLSSLMKRIGSKADRAA